MNIELVHQVLRRTLDDLAANNVQRDLDALTNAFQQMVSQPNQQNHQQAASNALSQLDAHSASSAVNEFDPLYLDILEGLGLADLLGNRLLERVTDAIEGRDLVPSRSLELLRPLNEELTRRIEGARQLAQGFAALEVGESEPEWGRAFLQVEIPERDGFQLKSVNADLESIHFIARTAGLVANDPAAVKIHSWSTGSLHLIVDIAEAAVPYLGLVISGGGLALQMVDRKKQLRDEARDAGMGEPVQAAIDAELEGAWDEEVAKLVGQAVEQFASSSDSMDATELSIHIEKSVRRGVDLLDQGHRFTFALARAPEDDGEDGEEEMVDRSDVIDIVQSVQFAPARTMPVHALEPPDEYEAFKRADEEEPGGQDDEETPDQDPDESAD